MDNITFAHLGAPNTFRLLATVSSAFHAALKLDPRLTEDCSIMETVYQADVGAFPAESLKLPLASARMGSGATRATSTP